MNLTASEIVSMLRLSNVLTYTRRAITAVRNDFTHAEKRYPDLTIEAKEELCRLGLHYLELVLLALMDYDGGYINRCFMHHESWKPIPVPWLNKT
jgi:hypothetical protein